MKISTSDDNFLRQNHLDFSVIKNNSVSYLLLGPLAYANHSRNQNTITDLNKKKNLFSLKTIKTINVGDEIFWSYGKNYFNVGECQCYTCNLSSGK